MRPRAADAAITTGVSVERSRMARSGMAAVSRRAAREWMTPMRRLPLRVLSEARRAADAAAAGMVSRAPRGEGGDGGGVTDNGEALGGFRFGVDGGLGVGADGDEFVLREGHNLLDGSVFGIGFVDEGKRGLGLRHGGFLV
jgi:hypothetical protein